MMVLATITQHDLITVLSCFFFLAEDGIRVRNVTGVQTCALPIFLGSRVEHELIDLGDDEYTRGRAHPMTDPTLRNRAIARAGTDPEVTVLLLDFILGL